MWNCMKKAGSTAVSYTHLNDALDMAAEKGESVAFTCAYIGNLRDLADTLEKYEAASGKKEVTLAKEMERCV